MKYYGLHFTSDDKVPMQVRIDQDSTPPQQVWARYAPAGRGWTPWRRLDVYYGEDGVLECTAREALHAADASHADLADIAKQLQTARKVSLTGDVTGSFTFDGSANVECKMTIPGGAVATALKKAAIKGMVRTERGALTAPNIEGTWACFCVWERTIRSGNPAVETEIVTKTIGTKLQILNVGEAIFVGNNEADGSVSYDVVGGFAIKVE